MFTSFYQKLIQYLWYSVSSISISHVSRRPHKRIVFVSDRVYPYFKGGAEKRYWQIAKSLVKSGYEVEFYTGQWPSMPKTTVQDRIRLNGVYKVKNFYVKGRKSIRESVSYTLALLPYLLVGDYDLIECEQFPLLPILLSKLIALLRQKPLVVTWHEVWGRKTWVEYLGHLGIIGACIEFICLRLPDHIISVSSCTTKRLIEQHRIESSKITTIPNGINYNQIFETQQTAQDSDLIFVGRLADHKRVDLLLALVTRLKEHNPGIKCLIVGTGPERQNLEALAKKLNIDDNVRFLGYIQDDAQVYSLIKSSRILILPSIREGFGIVVPEANACGVPVVVLNYENNAARELIIEGINGYVCDPDGAELPKTVMQILGEPREQYVYSCQKEARRFSWEWVGKDVEAIYQKLLSVKPIQPTHDKPITIPSQNETLIANPTREWPVVK